MIINKSGIVIRIGVADLRVMGRATQGVRLITFKGDDSIASVAKVSREEDEEDEDALNGEDVSSSDTPSSSEEPESDQE